MDTSLSQRFADLISAMSPAELEQEIAAPRALLLDSTVRGSKRFDVAYAPFEHVNTKARIVIVGLTPGRQQMRNALTEEARQLRRGASVAEALAAAKVHASFSGPMRANLVALLDALNVHRLLGIPSTASLWAEHEELINFTSALRYPVFVDGGNYSGNPAISAVPLLRDHLIRGFTSEMRMLPDALYIPLGPAVEKAVAAAAVEAGVDTQRILTGLPHPSGANAERIAFFLGRKPRHLLSAKVAPDRLEAARKRLEESVQILAKCRLV